MGAELSQMSLLYFLTYVAAAGNLKNLVEGTPYTAQEYKIKVLIIIHYENMPMQYTEIFKVVKNENFQ